MACPHSLIGDPSRCSQCIEAAGQLKVQVRRATRDATTGALLLDGKPEERPFQPAVSSRFSSMRSRKPDPADPDAN